LAADLHSVSGMRRFGIIILLLFISVPGLCVTLTQEDYDFLSSLGHRYRFGVEFEVTRKQLRHVVDYYDVYGRDERDDIQAIIDRPLTARLREKAPQEIHDTLQYFGLKPEHGGPDVEFYLRENTPDDIKRNPFKILELQDRFMKLLRISGLLANPLGPWVGVSIHNHFSRGDDESPQPFALSSVLAQFDFKAAYIYFRRAEDMFADRNLTIFFSPARAPGPLREVTASSNHILFEPRTILDRSTITNFRGEEIEELNAQLAKSPFIDCENLPTSNWIEDKGRIFDPTTQFIWTLKILEEKISLESIYNRVAEFILHDDLTRHILQQLQYKKSRKGLAVGLLFRTARHSSHYRHSLVIAVAKGLRDTQHETRQPNIITNFILSPSTAVDHEFMLECFDHALREDPKFIKSIGAVWNVDVANALGTKRIHDIVSKFSAVTQKEFYDSIGPSRQSGQDDCIDPLKK
jgi:hypothetical protein